MTEYERLLSVPVEERFDAIETSLAQRKISTGDARALMDQLDEEDDSED